MESTLAVGACRVRRLYIRGGVDHIPGLNGGDFPFKGTYSLPSINVNPSGALTLPRPKGLNSGAEFNAAPKRLRGGSDASSGGSIFLALAVLAP